MCGTNEVVINERLKQQ